MPVKPNGDMDWNKFFMGMAVAVVFVLQGYTQLQQSSHGKEIKQLKTETLTDSEISEKIDDKLERVIQDILEIDRETLELNKEWMEWQKKNAKN